MNVIVTLFKGAMLQAALSMSKKALKTGAGFIVHAEGAALRAKLAELIKLEGPKAKAAVDGFFDGHQAELIGKLQAVPLIPQRYKDAACAVIQDEGDRLQARADKAVEQDAPQELDRLFDDAEQAILTRIEAL